MLLRQEEWHDFFFNNSNNYKRNKNNNNKNNNNNCRRECCEGKCRYNIAIYSNDGEKPWMDHDLLDELWIPRPLYAWDFIEQEALMIFKSSFKT